MQKYFHKILHYGKFLSKKTIAVRGKRFMKCSTPLKLEENIKPYEWTRKRTTEINITLSVTKIIHVIALRISRFHLTTKHSLVDIALRDL